MVAVPVTPVFVVQNAEGIDLTLVTNITASTPEYPAPPFAVGTRVVATDGSEWIYVQNGTGGALTQYQAIWIDPTFSAITPVGGAGLRPEIGAGMIGFVQWSGIGASVNTPAASLSQYYFWALISGVPNVLVASAGITVPLYTCDTAGALTGTTNTASHSQIMGVACVVTASGSTASVTQCFAAFPVVSRTGG